MNQENPSIEEQRKLLQTIKFYPRTYRLEIVGAGLRSVVGAIDEAAFEYWDKSVVNDAVHYYVFDDEVNLNIPDVANFLGGKEWYELNDVWSIYGAKCNGVSEVTVYDEHENIVWCEFLSPTICSPRKLSRNLLPNGTFFCCDASLEGIVYSGNIDLLNTFDPKNLTFHGVNVNRNTIVDKIDYLGIDINNRNSSYQTEDCNVKLRKV